MSDDLRDTDRVTQIVAATQTATQAATQTQKVANRRMRLLIAWCWMTGCGLVLVIVGSFLPWVISGTVKRSSYEIIGVIDRLGIARDGFVAGLVSNWPLLGVLCFAPVVAAAFRWWRLAVGLTVRLDPLGPSVMAAGGLLLVGGGLCMTFGNSSPIRRIEGRSGTADQS